MPLLAWSKVTAALLAMSPCRLVVLPERTGVDRGAAAVGVGAATASTSPSALGQGAGAAHHTGVGAVGGLVESHRGVIGDVALQAGRVARSMPPLTVVSPV